MNTLKVSTDLSGSEQSVDILEVVTAAYAHVFAGVALTSDSDFFELGGDSISALEVTLHLEKALGWPVEPALLIHHPRILDLAAALTSEWSKIQASRNV
jgi:acyl carrier protein